jgi:hypothetical protein
MAFVGHGHLITNDYAKAVADAIYVDYRVQLYREDPYVRFGAAANRRR